MRRFLTNIARLFFGKRNSNSLSRGYVLAFDIFLVIMALIFVPLVGYYPNYSKVNLLQFYQETISILLFFIIGFIVTGSYKGLVRYTGFKDIESITKTTGGVFVVLCICKYLTNNIDVLHYFSRFFCNYLLMFLICIVALVFIVF